nr:bcl-2-interacting killer [Ictidomys tridecemlineatus]
MSEARPVSRSLLRYRPGPLLAAGASCLTPPAGEEALRPGGRLHLMVQGSHQVALRLACIGDEMDLCFQDLQLAQLPGMAMHSLALSYSQARVTGVLRSLAQGLASLRENMWFWRPAAPSTRVPPARACRELLPVLLLLGLLLSRALYLRLQ